MKDTTKIFIKMLLIIGVIFSVYIVVSIGKFVYIMGYEVTDIASYTSQNNDYKVYFQEIGEAVLFGPSTIRLKVTEGKNQRIIEEFRTQILNDGTSLKPSNCHVEWGDSIVTVTLSGNEQDDEVHVIPLSN